MGDKLLAKGVSKNTKHHSPQANILVSGNSASKWWRLRRELRDFLSLVTGFKWTRRCPAFPRDALPQPIRFLKFCLLNFDSADRSDKCESDSKSALPNAQPLALAGILVLLIMLQEFNWHDPPKLDDILNPLETSQIQVSHSILPDSTTPLASASYSALHHSKASNDATSNLSTNHFNPDHSFRDSFERFYHGKSIVNNNVTPDSEANWWKDFEGTFGEHHQNSLTFPSTSTLHQTIQENHTEPEYLPYIQPEEIIEPTDYNPTGPYEVTEMHKME
ncbi:hypothetical protein PGT21_016094 [Puccinia graminis f. sp. tritici]|uniref:Uncharacterized protein n=1 Tax=Puccinia graminis f. sp. tritici TaxID=56615 RepID=A0A5B0QFC0_PUCGR|nr:hypothetical protein PGT21_016094 [Puccinia graminis f. sp. tritici]